MGFTEGDGYEQYIRSHNYYFCRDINAYLVASMSLSDSRTFLLTPSLACSSARLFFSACSLVRGFSFINPDDVDAPAVFSLLTDAPGVFSLPEDEADAFSFEEEDDVDALSVLSRLWVLCSEALCSRPRSLTRATICSSFLSFLSGFVFAV